MNQHDTLFRQGTKVEDLFEHHLKKCGAPYIRYTMDTPKGREMQLQKHVDFKVQGLYVDTKGGTTITKYGNVAFEFEQYQYGKQLNSFWLRDTIADIYAYYDLYNKHWYYFNVRKVKELLAKIHYPDAWTKDKNDIESHFFYMSINEPGILIKKFKGE